MLSTIAAIITIAGSLFVAGSALIERVRLKEERAARKRTRDLINARIEQSRAEGISSAERTRLLEEAKRLEQRLHAASGRTPTPSYGDVQLSLSMSAPLPSKWDAVRQWVLLLSSAAGVILVAVDLATTNGG